MGWTLPDAGHVQTVSAIASILESKSPRIRIHKHTKSVFNACPDLAQQLRMSGIEELHIVGFDANDCVLASALDAFDAGFVTYVIEDCCGASSGEEVKKSGLKVLRHLCLTNHSVWEAVPFIRL